MTSLDLNDPAIFEESSPWYRSPVFATGLVLLAAVAIAFSIHSWTLARQEQKTNAFLAAYDQASDNAARLHLVQTNADLPETAVAALQLGGAFAQTKDLASAQTAFNFVIVHFPKHPLAAGAWLGLGQIEEAQGKLDHAAQSLQKAVAFPSLGADGYRPFALLTLARVRQENKNISGARQTLQELIVKYPNSSFIPEAQALLGRLGS